LQTLDYLGNDPCSVLCNKHYVFMFLSNFCIAQSQLGYLKPIKHASPCSLGSVSDVQAIVEN
jgi:hypothetical protein